MQMRHQQRYSDSGLYLSLSEVEFNYMEHRSNLRILHYVYYFDNFYVTCMIGFYSHKRLPVQLLFPP